MKQKNPNQILSPSRALIYAIGIFGVQLFVGYVNNFQMEFYNKMYSGFDSNIFYASAIIIFAAKILSCVSDPIIGSFIDRGNLKGGKIRPWILFSAPPIAILTTVLFIFIPFNSKPLLYGYITLTTVLWNIAMSFADIPSQGMLSRLSPNVGERDLAASLSNIAKSAALAAPGVFVTIVMLLLNVIKGEGNYPDKTYYLITALFIMLFGSFCYMLIYWKNREAVKNAPPATVTFKDMFAEMKSNKMIFIVFLVYLLGFARAMTIIVMVQANGALIGKVNFLGTVMDTTADASWLPGLLGAVTGIIGVSVIPIINKKLGEKKTYIMFTTGMFFFGMACCVFYWLLPADSPLRYGNPALYFIMATQLVSALLFSANTYIPLIMTADIVDYQHWKTGQRKEGVNFAILSMSIKISTALCVAVGLLLIAFSGYSQVVYETGSIPVRTQNIVMFAYMGFAAVSSLVSAVPMLFYKIDAKTKKELEGWRASEELGIKNP
ncbi:MAG: MFS transporter [Oscillospiraceae bacterium]|nr:MFS transporter [Oscillospiraceae bacterium]